MPVVKVYNQKGEIIGEQKLHSGIFNKDIQAGTLHQVVVAQRANARKKIAHTKDRSEVRGGGRKPWRQKGTGRARHGSIRSPIWRGGGVTFGPRKERNFAKLINKKMARSALLMALTDRVESNHMVLLDKLALSKIKTKELFQILENLPNRGVKTLLLLSREEKSIKRAADNLKGVFPHKADSLKALTVITYPYLMLTKAGLAELTKQYQQHHKTS